MKEEDYILFENYLSNELTSNEVEHFESRLKTDLEFNQSFNTYKSMTSFLEHKFENEEASKAFQDNVKRISNTHFNTEKTVSTKNQKSKIKNLYKYAVAASIILLLGIFTFNQFSNPTYSDFSNYDTISLTVRGHNNTLLKTAEQAFNNRDFTTAEQAFKSLVELDEDNSEFKLYQAISNIELDNFEVSDALLNNLKSGNSAYKNKATWYLALSKLKQGNNNACIEILKLIPEEADYYKQAKSLMNKLD